MKASIRHRSRQSCTCLRGVAVVSEGVAQALGEQMGLRNCRKMSAAVMLTPVDYSEITLRQLSGRFGERYGLPPKTSIAVGVGPGSSTGNELCWLC